MPEITRKVRIGKILTFSIDERVFGKLENTFDMITGRFQQMDGYGTVYGLPLYH